jgi:uncharacterized protein (TIGR02466 family)
MNLNFTGYFSTPIYSIHIDEWVKPLIKTTNILIKKIKNKNIESFGKSYHSDSLINVPEFKKFKDFVFKFSNNILDHMGYDLKNYELFFTELWVQEFSKKGGGHHEGHIHYDNHVSGFYFLKCSDKTSIPIFHDPRPAKLMTQLPLKNEQDITLGSSMIHFKPKPGTMIFFPAYMEHQYIVDDGIEPFRFIHFNLQAVRKIITNTVRNLKKS